MAPKDKSPDDNANTAIGKQMRAYAGSFYGEKLYPGEANVNQTVTVLKHVLDAGQHVRLKAVPR